jgi:hypothetical protein
MKSKYPLNQFSLKSVLDLKKLFTKENLYAIIFCLILIALVIVTADQAPQWIYQGF